MRIKPIFLTRELVKASKGKILKMEMKNAWTEDRLINEKSHYKTWEIHDKGTAEQPRSWDTW